MTRAAFFCDGETRINMVYAQGRRQKVEALANFYPEVVSGRDFDRHVEKLADLEVIFSTWGMPRLTGEQIDRLPKLKAVFYAAGSVQYFAAPFLDRGIEVVSAWAANAIPVAEFTVAQILLANKGYFSNTMAFTSPERVRAAYRGRGNFGGTVALLGAGQIGRHVLNLLRPFHLKVLVFDPYLADETAAELGVEKVSLEDAFRRGGVVSNHLANLPATVRMLKGEHFRSMPQHATFINTGRGATVAEDEMVAALRERPDLTALLDVTYPEPPVEGSLLYSLPNVHLSSHIAGSIGDEVVRMADYVIEEYEAWRDGRPLRFGVTREMLETMA